MYKDMSGRPDASSGDRSGRLDDNIGSYIVLDFAMAAALKLTKLGFTTRANNICLVTRPPYMIMRDRLVVWLLESKVFAALLFATWNSPKNVNSLSRSSPTFLPRNYLKWRADSLAKVA